MAIDDDWHSVQAADPQISGLVDLFSREQSPRPVAGPYRRIWSQLRVEDGVLVRRHKVPPDTLVDALVLPTSRGQKGALRVHHECAHAGWETVRQRLRRKFFFPKMAEVCRKLVRDCVKCICADPAAAEKTVPAVESVVPDRPWQVIQLDVLHIPSRQFMGFLVVVDVFSKWLEVRPLVSTKQLVVQETLASVFFRWGPPEVARCDSGLDVLNSATQALYKQLGVQVRPGAVGHSESQGMVERTNRTILNMLRKVLDDEVWSDRIEEVVYTYNSVIWSYSSVATFCHVRRLAWFR